MPVDAASTTLRPFWDVLFSISHHLSMVELQPSSSLSTGYVVSLRRDWAIFCHAGSGRVDRVRSAREKSLEILRRGWELNPGHGEDRQWAIPLSYHDWDVECCIIISNKKPCSGISEPLNHKNHERSGKVWKESVSVKTRSHIEKDGCHWSNILRRILFNKWRCTNSNITDWVIDGSLFLWLNQYSKQRDGFHWLADDCWIFLYYKLLFLFA